MARGRARQPVGRRASARARAFRRRSDCAYGTQTAKTGTLSTPFGYDGQYTDAESGLQYLRARMYDPSTGQFLTRDPIEQQTEAPYQFAGGNPMLFGDPTGMSLGSVLKKVAVGTGIVVAVGVAGAACVLGGCEAAAAGLAGGAIIDGVAAVGGEVAAAGAEAAAAAGEASAAAAEAGAAEAGGAVEAGIGDLAGDAPCPVRESSDQIANGHAFDKHVVARGEFPEISNSNQLARTIERVRANGEAKTLSNGRTAYYDVSDNTLVVRNPGGKDGGTVFRPEAGRAYFEQLR